MTLNADGSYTYTADQDAANSLKRGDSAIDYFNYTVSDGTGTDTALITITVIGVNDATSATNVSTFCTGIALLGTTLLDSHVEVI